MKASFFLTGRYMHDNPGITRRIFKHGHLVCNHTYSHPKMTALAGDRGAFTSQVRATERAYHAATGARLAPYFRPPYGIYSARTLDLIRDLGYSTVFWSFAYVDYNERCATAGERRQGAPHRRRQSRRHLPSPCRLDQQRQCTDSCDPGSQAPRLPVRDAGRVALSAAPVGLGSIRPGRLLRGLPTPVTITGVVPFVR